MNDAIPKDLCSLKYATVDQAVRRILSLGISQNGYPACLPQHPSLPNRQEVPGNVLERTHVCTHGPTFWLKVGSENFLTPLPTPWNRCYPIEESPTLCTTWMTCLSLGHHPSLFLHPMIFTSRYQPSTHFLYSSIDEYPQNRIIRTPGCHTHLWKSGKED